MNKLLEKLANDYNVPMSQVQSLLISGGQVLTETDGGNPTIGQLFVYEI